VTIWFNAINTKKVITQKFGPFQWVPGAIRGAVISGFYYNDWGALKMVFKMFEVLI